MEKIFTAKTLDEAKQMASEEFGLDILDIRFEIIEQPAKKLFGTKGDFRVRATCEAAQKNANAAHAPAPTVSAKQQTASAAVPAVPTSELANPEGYEHVIDYLKKILTALGVKDFAVNVKPDGENVVLDVTGDDLGIIIGRRGETLDSLQYLAILANNRGGESGSHPRVIVDCNGYREKRADALQTLAVRTANKVLKQGRRVTLEPMNPYERRIIHSKVAEISGVFSNSIGEEPFRKVVISSETPKRRESRDDSRGGEKRDNRDGRGGGNNKRRDNGGVTGRTYKQSSGFSTSFEREYKRVPAAEIPEEIADIEKNTTLYGKIEL